MPVVVDSSVAACWALPDEYSALADRVLEFIIEDGMMAPALFRYELRNVLIVNERRGRIDRTTIEKALTMIDRLPCRIDIAFTDGNLLALARRNQLKVYDAAYLELALRTGAPLATLDRRLAGAAAAEGVTILA